MGICKSTPPCCASCHFVYGLNTEAYRCCGWWWWRPLGRWAVCDARVAAGVSGALGARGRGGGAVRGRARAAAAARAARRAVRAAGRAARARHLQRVLPRAARRRPAPRALPHHRARRHAAALALAAPRDTRGANGLPGARRL